MLEMVWDDELATLAQNWANQCKFGHDKPKCSRFGVGQNVFQSSSSNKGDTTAPMFEATEAWFNEVYKPGFSASSIQPYCFSSGTGHYTQVVWAKTYTVGAGYVMYQSGGWFNKYVVCNYGPAGNMMGGCMYIRGTPRCPADCIPSKRYPGLWVNPQVKAIMKDDVVEVKPPEQTKESTKTKKKPKKVESSEEESEPESEGEEEEEEENWAGREEALKAALELKAAVGAMIAAAGAANLEDATAAAKQCTKALKQVKAQF